ncbi:hypothetical protein GCM10017600_00870 [Streptosporangium carneum]|uniref:Uncharacterized protein n=1 Tax=Streptosporangium carneum TaxID=47481 RepID=A0A9W6HVB1_9ACTN|nr:hypothetical protein GCM10017600_00870 [Streptosporangium carneum]
MFGLTSAVIAPLFGPGAAQAAQAERMHGAAPGQQPVSDTFTPWKGSAALPPRNVNAARTSCPTADASVELFDSPGRLQAGDPPG